MATLTELREAIASNLGGFKAQGWQVSAYMLANPTPPAIHVMPSEIIYDKASGRGLDDVELKVQAFVALSSDKGSQMRLDELIDPTGLGSLKTQVESDRSLGGLVGTHATHVTDCSGYQVVPIEGRGPVLMVEWTVAVMASN